MEHWFTKYSATISSGRVRAPSPSTSASAQMAAYHEGFGSGVRLSAARPSAPLTRSPSRASAGHCDAYEMASACDSGGHGCDGEGAGAWGGNAPTPAPTPPYGPAGVGDASAGGGGGGYPPCCWGGGGCGNSIPAMRGGGGAGHCPVRSNLKARVSAGVLGGAYKTGAKSQEVDARRVVVTQHCSRLRQRHQLHRCRERPRVQHSLLSRELEKTATTVVSCLRIGVRKIPHALQRRLGQP